MPLRNRQADQLNIYASLAGRLSAMRYHVSAMCSSMIRCDCDAAWCAMYRHSFALVRQRSAVNWPAFSVKDIKLRLLRGVRETPPLLRWRHLRNGSSTACRFAAADLPLHDSACTSYESF